MRKKASPGITKPHISRTGRFIIFLLTWILLLQSAVFTPMAAVMDAPDQAADIIAFATDLHIDPELRDKGTVNPLTLYNMEIIDALLWDVREENAEILILCGDLTNGGRRIQHEAMVEKLKKAESTGLTIYALPGNHDIQEVTTADFPQLYQDFGYGEAFSRDTDSLSYSVIREAQMFLMIDTDGYSNRFNGSYVSDQSRAWIETQLLYARDHDLQVIPVGHYSLVSGQTTEFKGQEELKALLKKYDIPLYVCGHLHLKRIAKEDKLTELVVEQAISYPCSYEIMSRVHNEKISDVQPDDGEELNDHDLEMRNDIYEIRPKKIDISQWALATSNTNPDLLHFDDFQNGKMLDKSRQTVESLIKGRDFTPEELEVAVEFYWQFETQLSMGVTEEDIRNLTSHPGYQVFMTLAEGTVYSRWLPAILSQPSQTF